MKSLKTLLILIFFPLSLLANGWNDTEYKEIEDNIMLPSIANRMFNVTTYGASTTASAAENQKAINKAIDLANDKGGGNVIVPKGTYLTGAIRLKSHINLVLEEGAVLKFAFEPELYPLVKTSWEGLGCWNYSPCIYAYKATDIAITGKGTIDGNGSNETWWKWCGKAKFGFKKVRQKSLSL